MTEALRAWLTLARVPNLGGATVRRLLDQFGSPEAIVSAAPSRLQQGGLKPDACAAIGDPQHLESDLAWLDGDAARHAIALDDPRYPPQLQDIASPPLVLWVVGDPEVLGVPQIAMVGSRNPSPQGRENAGAFAASFARQGLTVISGLAMGIDGAAHQGALDGGGLTIAVCGTGLDRVYPARHRDLAHAIAAEGALVSEFGPGMGPLAANFPRRNRIISGLSLGTLVVEAALKSGSLITARQAMEQGREVFAIPGSIHNPLARGCHKLIRDGAKLVETAADVFEELAPQIQAAGLSLTAPSNASMAVPTDAPDGDYAALLAALGDAPSSIDQLVERSGLTTPEVSSMLLMLELEGRVALAPGGGFMKLPENAGRT